MIGGHYRRAFCRLHARGRGRPGLRNPLREQPDGDDYLFALVFAATVLGFAFFFLVMFLEWHFLHNWHESSRPQTGRIRRRTVDVANGIGNRLVADHAIPITRIWPARSPTRLGQRAVSQARAARPRAAKASPATTMAGPTRDAHPAITRQGKPSAFSAELVGKYSAFEEIDLEDYLAVRDRAVRMIAEEDPYAGLLISMHTYNLLTAHADRSTIAAEARAARRFSRAGSAAISSESARRNCR